MNMTSIEWVGQRVVAFVAFATFASQLAFGGSALAQGAMALDRRVALVVGNASYKTSPLKNPPNDARDVAAALRRLNFDVIERTNLSREGLSVAVREFGDRLKGANVALFYFAGHGLQVKGKNYLVPVDADIAREDEVPYRSVDVNEVLDKMDSARTPINLVILDACRNNPFGRSFRLAQTGLAQMDAPQGTLISFATAPGSVAQDGEGTNGLFTGAMLKHLSTPGLAVEQLFKRVRVDVSRESNSQQIPWESSSLNRDFSFASVPIEDRVTRPAPASVSAPAIGAGISSDTAVELAFWESVRNSSNPADFAAYLEQFPSGRFVALARLRVRPSAANSSGDVTARAALPYGNALSVYGLASGRVLLSRAKDFARTNVSLGTNEAVTALAVSSDGMVMAALSGARLHWIDLERGLLIRASDWRMDSSSKLGTIHFAPAGRWMLVATVSSGATAHHLFEVSTGKHLWTKPSDSARFDSRTATVTLKSADAETTLSLQP